MHEKLSAEGLPHSKPSMHFELLPSMRGAGAYGRHPTLARSPLYTLSRRVWGELAGQEGREGRFPRKPWDLGPELRVCLEQVEGASRSLPSLLKEC